jgi:DNA polymerase-3 subunit gamma/tau
MSYQVLARKWRPQKFEDVVGQDPIAQALQNAIATKRVAHAYLFAGPRGVGKTSVARILAKALNCQAGPTPQPCGQCTACNEIREVNAVDVLEIDGASNRGINEIRELRENVKYLPSKCRYKVYIIDEVHMLTTEAFNALLKTLEEPPAHVIFVLATTEPHKIPLTILSRCQRYNFKRIPLTRILEHLQAIAAEEKVEVSATSLRLIAREAEGSMRDAQSLLDQVLSFGGEKVSDDEVIEALGIIDRKTLHEVIQALAEGDRRRLLQLIASVHRFGYDVKEFCGELAKLTRDLMVLKVFPEEGAGGSELVDLPEEEIQELSRRTEKFSLEEIQSLFRSLLDAHDEAARSAFPRLLLEMTLLRAARRRPILAMEEVLERLEAMEERLLQPMEAAGASVLPKALPEPNEEGEEEDGLESVGEEDQPGYRKAPGPSLKEFSPGATGRQEFSKGMDRATTDAWNEFIRFAKKKKPPLASLLEHGQPLVLNGDSLEVGYPEKSFYLERMQEADNRELTEALCREYFKRPMRVSITGLDSRVFSPGNSDAPNGESGKKNSTRETQENTLNHPLVREAISIFGGRVVEIKPT